MYNDEFRVDTYIDKEVPDELKDSEYANRLDSAMCRGIQKPSSEQDLEDQYRDFLDQPIDLRRMANHMSREIYGLTNEELYTKYKSIYLNGDDGYKDPNSLPTIVSSRGFCEEVEDFTKLDSSEMDPINQDKIDQAKAFMNDTYWTIIIPTNTLDELEEAWLRFTSMTMKQRRLSDSKSIEIFGCTNQNMYELLKSAFLKHDIDDVDEIKSDVVEGVNKIRGTVLSESGRLINEMLSYDKDSNRPDIISSIIKLNEMNLDGQESILANRAIKDVISSYEGSPEIVDNAPINLPFFDPIEISDMMDMDFSHPISNIDDFEMDGLKVSDWWNSYCLEFFGCPNQAYRENSVKWVEFVRKESYRYKNPLNEETKKESERKLRQVGWNPDLEYNPISAATASWRTKVKMDTIKNTDSIVDLTGFRASPSVYSESLKFSTDPKKYGVNKDLYPIYIVLVEGHSLFSKAVKKFTDGPFSHVAIGFDSSLKELYSYNMDSKYSQDIGGRKSNGFSIEGVGKYKGATHIGVYTIFVKEKEYNKMQALIDLYMGSKTHYSMGNVLRLVFNIPTKGSFNMICSQFVDNILKISDIDLTGKVSNLVNPNDFLVKAKNNKRIYKVFEGTCAEYDKHKVDAIFKNMDSNERVKYVKEDALLKVYEEGDMINYNSYLPLFESSPLMNQVYDTIVRPVSEIRVVCEAKKFPIQFGDEGELLIHNMYHLDFSAEWEISHRLLKEYEEANNTEGIKYELCKLWFMSKLLSKRIKHKSFKKDKKDMMDMRARILNDFNKYMKVLMKLEQNFNFTKYYNDTPFSDAVTQIDASTLKYTGEYLKRLVSGIL